MCAGSSNTSDRRTHPKNSRSCSRSPIQSSMQVSSLSTCRRWRRRRSRRSPRWPGRNRACCGKSSNRATAISGSTRSALRHSRHAGHAPGLFQLTALSDDFSGALHRHHRLLHQTHHHHTAPSPRRHDPGTRTIRHGRNTTRRNRRRDHRETPRLNGALKWHDSGLSPANAVSRSRNHPAPHSPPAAATLGTRPRQPSTPATHPPVAPTADRRDDATTVADIEPGPDSCHILVTWLGGSLRPGVLAAGSARLGH